MIWWQFFCSNLLSLGSMENQGHPSSRESSWSVSVCEPAPWTCIGIHQDSPESSSCVHSRHGWTQLPWIRQRQRSSFLHTFTPPSSPWWSLSPTRSEMVLCPCAKNLPRLLVPLQKIASTTATWKHWSFCKKCKELARKTSGGYTQRCNSRGTGWNIPR